MDNKKNWEDPILLEVRKNREKLLSQHGNDIDKYCESISASEEESKKNGFKFVNRKPKKLNSA